MGNENGTMETDIASTGIDDGISQTQMQDSFTEQFQVVDDDGTPIEQPSKEAAPQPVPAKPAPTEPPPSSASTPPAPTVTDYAAEFHNPDGTLNIEKAMELFGTKKEPPPQAPVQPQSVAVLPPEKPVVPIAPEDPYQQMRKSYTAALELQRYYMGKGLDSEQAMAQAERDIDDHLREHFMKTEMQKMKDDWGKEKSALLDQVKTERELAIAEPIAEKNLINTISKYAKGMSAETLRNAIFDSKLGGQFLTDLFILANPDKEKLMGNDLNKAMNDWFVKSASKNVKFVEALAINAINRIQQLVQPELAKLIQKNALERKGIQQATKPGPRTAQSSTPNNAGGQASILDQFLHNVPRETPAGRPHI
jgi:hypothetical protein